ncbi:MAG: hypothetical protein ACLQUY_03420 [Ktedonobacterales bacterium]
MSAPTNISTPEGSVPSITPPYTPSPQAAPLIPSPRGNRTWTIVAIGAAVVLVPLMLCAGIALFAGGIGLFVATHQVEQTATSQFQFTVSAHPTVSVFDSAGQVTITSGAVKQVSVLATKQVRAMDSSVARQVLDGIKVTSVPTANGVSINAMTGQGHPLSQQSVDLRITVPQTSDLNVTITAGTLQISSISGVFAVTDTAGTVNLQNVTLQGQTTLKVSTGTFLFDGSLATHARVAVNIGTGTAAVSLPQTSATHFDAATQVGDLTVSGWPATINQSGVGRSTVFDLNPQPSNTMTVLVDVGSITVTAR